jgi:uracil-DNA glycosylase
MIGRVEQATRKPLSYAIVNTVACIPLEVPGSGQRTIRPPTEDEQRACLPWLQHFLGHAAPRGVVYLGKVAANSLFAKTIAESWHLYETLSVPHPAYFLRTGGATSYRCAEAVLNIVRFVGTLQHRRRSR